MTVRGAVGRIPEIATAPEGSVGLQESALRASVARWKPGSRRVAGRAGGLVTVNSQTNPWAGLPRGGWIGLRSPNASGARSYGLRQEGRPTPGTGQFGNLTPDARRAPPAKPRSKSSRRPCFFDAAKIRFPA